jgi:TonB family protein
MPSLPEIQFADQFVDVPALLVEARFRGRPLASRLLRAGERGRFVIGAGRGADAPVDAAFVAAVPGNDNHVLVQPSGAGFLVALSPAMRVRAQGTAAHLRLPCGEVVFDLTAAEIPPAVPRPWLSTRAKDLAPYVAGVAAALLALVLVFQMVPSDPRSLSLDDVGRNVRLDVYRIKPPVTPTPRVFGHGPAGGDARVASSGQAGVAGDRRARPADTRHATKGPAPRQDARAVEQYVRDSTLLAVLDGPRGQAFAQVLATTPALGGDAETVLAHLQGQTYADAYGTGRGAKGSGAGGADTGKGLIGGAPGLGTIGRHGGDGGLERYGDRAAPLATRKAIGPQIIPHPVTVRGSLDKEIVRRVVRAHLNEVRYCYERALARRPSLSGRVVANFTIAPTGRVIASLLQSSTLGEGSVDACVVEAIRRWEFPKPDGGGVAIVTYPFQLAPAGG